MDTCRIQVWEKRIRTDTTNRLAHIHPLTSAQIYKLAACPCVTSGLCMPFTFLMLMKRTSEEFNIKVARWGGRHPRHKSTNCPLHNHMLTGWRARGCDWKNVKASCNNHLHRHSWGKSRTTQNGTNDHYCFNNLIKTVRVQPPLLHVSVWLQRYWPMTN